MAYYMLNDPDVKRGGQDPCDRALTRELYRKKEVSKKDFQRAMNWTENEFRTHMLTAVGVLRTKTGRTRASFCRGEATPLYRIRDGESIVYCTAEEANVEFWQLDPQDMRETGHIRGAGVNKLQMADEDFRPSVDPATMDDYEVPEGEGEALQQRTVPGNYMRSFLADGFLAFTSKQMQLHEKLRDPMTEMQHFDAKKTFAFQRPEAAQKAVSRSPETKKKPVKLMSALLCIRPAMADNGVEKVLKVRDLMDQGMEVPGANKDYVGDDARFQNLTDHARDQLDSRLGYFVYQDEGGRSVYIDGDVTLGKALEDMKRRRDGLMLLWAKNPVPPMSQFYPFISGRICALVCRV